jgi:hypothetical protein
MRKILLIGIVLSASIFGASDSDAVVFSTSTAININDFSLAPNPATPYPTTINVSGFPTNAAIRKVTVTIRSFSHFIPDDVDMMLVGPTGARFVFFSDCGGGNPVFNQTFTFDDDAATRMPDNTPVLTTGTWQPSSYGTAVDSFFEAPIPIAPGNFAPTNGTGTFAGVFNGTKPNGVWTLYIMDDSAQQATGSITNGWQLNINASALPVIQNVSRTGTNMTFQFVSQNALGHVIQYKDSLDVTNWTTLQTIVGDGTLKTVTITNILAPAERYYRIRIP